MPHTKCRQCRVADSVTPGGMCETCHAASDPTRPTACPPAPPKHLAPAGLLPPAGYLILERLGGGGMGEVFRAVRTATQQAVAVKRMRPDAFTPAGLRRFVAEARMLAEVDHPNVVRLLDFVPDPSDPLLVMELVDGGPLSKRVADDRPLPPELAARLMAAAAHGVAAAHAAGIIHRDLKPSNLLVTPDDRVKVVDFGLGKRLDDADGLTRTGHSAGGTPGYMAPEQVDVTLADAGPATDVWGLGACLYFALTGTPPFPTGQSRRSVLTDPLVPPRRVNRAVPPVLDAICCKCLEKDPDDRYPSAAAVADDLERFARGESTDARPLAWPAKVWRRVRATPRAAAVAWAALTVTLAVVGVAAFLAPRQPPVNAEPVDELARLREQYLAGEEVTLVPAKGLPAWREWALGRAEIAESPGRDGTAYFHPPGAAALTLFDPPTDSYTLTADLLQRAVWDVKEEAVNRVGVMLFHRRTEAGGPDSVESFLTVNFQDYDPGVLKNRPPVQSQPVVVETYHQYRPNPNRGTAPYHLWVGGPPAVRFPAGPIFSGMWRRIVAEVAPTGLKVWWRADADDPASPLELVGDYSADEMHRHYATHFSIVKRGARLTKMNPDLIPSVWNPTGGLGVWSDTSGLAFRNVTVRKNP